jgi:carbamoyltransferase
MNSYILGLSAFYHDSAACLLKDGEIIAAAEEERFSRKKGDARFPREAIAYCLDKVGIDASALEMIVYYDKPILTFARLLQSYLEFPFSSFRSFKKSLPLWIHEKLKIPQVIDEALPAFRGQLYFSRHHESHAASAFFCSPFEEAALLVVDGVGEWACTSIGHGRSNTLKIMKEGRFPHSLGLFYTTITQYLGFKVNSDEYKVMGLAPYGEPKYVDLLKKNLIDIKDDGSLALNLEYFDFPHGLKMMSKKLPSVLGQPARHPESQLEQFHMDMAASIQVIANEAMLKLAKTAKKLTGAENLCLAGGVALNCVANGHIYRNNLFKNIYIQPAAGDAGGAIGAALQGWHQILNKPRDKPRDKMQGALFGPGIQSEAASNYLTSVGANFREFTKTELPKQVAQWIAAGHIIGFCQSGMEFGPRALGARSLLGDPRDPETQSRMNLKVKYRESFRPFAPAILQSHARAFFELDIPSPYMLLVLPLREDRQKNRDQNSATQAIDKLRIIRSEVPAVSHVDYSVRIQTVTPESNPLFHDVISEFHKLTGCPMVVNTSFNVRGEPIVCSHEDAYRCFLMTDIDILVLDNLVVTKAGIDLTRQARDFAARHNDKK